MHKLAEEQLRKARDSKRARPDPSRPSQDEMAYWGYKFESLCSLDKPYVDATRSEIEARKTAIVSNAEQFCSIVQTGIDDLSIVLAGEVDAVRGIKPDNPESPIPWVEFKTNRALTSDQDYRFWSEKLLRIWAQSYLLGVPTVVVGFRSQLGQLLSIEEFETRALPGLAKGIAVRQGRLPWDGSICINFAGALLRLMKENIKRPGQVWRVQRQQDQPSIRIFPVEDISADSIITPSFAKHRSSNADVT